MSLTGYQQRKLQRHQFRDGMLCIFLLVFFLLIVPFFSFFFLASRFFSPKNGKITRLTSSICRHKVKTRSGFVNVTVFCHFFLTVKFATLWKDKHNQEQNYVRHWPENVVLYLSIVSFKDTYRGLWRHTAKNILTVFWIRMIAAARNSIFFITEMKQWTQMKTINNN